MGDRFLCFIYRLHLFISREIRDVLKEPPKYALINNNEKKDLQPYRNKNEIFY